MKIVASIVVITGDDIVHIKVVEVKQRDIFISLKTSNIKNFFNYHYNKLVAAIDEIYPATICIFSDIEKPDSNIINIVVQFHDVHPERFNLYLWPNEYFERKFSKINRKSRSIGLQNCLKINSEFSELLALLASECVHQINLIEEYKKICDLNAAKYVLLYLAIKNAEDKLGQFENKLLEALVDTALTSHSHLILNETELVLGERREAITSNCYICGNMTVETEHSYGKNAQLLFVQTICPLCEIISVRSDGFGMVQISCEKIIHRGETLEVSIEFIPYAKKTLAMKMVGVLINGEISFFLNGDDAYNGKTSFQQTLKIPSNLEPGLNYLRIIALAEGNISISHKQLLVS